MIIVAYKDTTRREQFINDLKAKLTNWILIKEDTTNMEEWRTTHQNGVIIMDNYPTEAKHIDDMQRDIHRRSSTPTHICFTPDAKSIYYSTTYIVSDVVPMTSRSILVGLDPGEKNMGVSIIMLSSGAIERIYSFVYNITEMRDHIDADKTAGVIMRDNESIKHLFHIIMSFGYPIAYVVIELQNKSNTKAFGLVHALTMFCQLCNIKVRVAHPRVKFGLLHLEVPKNYKERKDNTVLMMSNLLANSEFHIMLGLPNHFIYNQLENVINTEGKMDDMADALIQALTIGIEQKFITSITLEHLYELADPNNKLHYSTSKMSKEKLYSLDD